MRKEIRGLWMRLLGMRPMTNEQWRRWAIEQAVACGANHNQIQWTARDIMQFVFPPEYPPQDEPPEEHVPVEVIREAT